MSQLGRSRHCPVSKDYLYELIVYLQDNYIILFVFDIVSQNQKRKPIVLRPCLFLYILFIFIFMFMKGYKQMSINTSGKLSYCFHILSRLIKK